MNSFLRQALLFFLFPFFCIMLLESIISVSNSYIFNEKFLDRVYKEEAKNYAWIENLKGDSIIILAGSSSVRYGLSCSILNKLDSSNTIHASIAMNGRDPIQTYFILKNMNLDRIKSVYFGLDPWIYSKKYYKHRNYYLYLDLNIVECISFYRKEDKSVFLKRYKSFLKLLLGINQSVKENLVIPNDFGSVTLNTEAVNFDATTDLFQKDKYGWSEIQFEYLAKIENMCKIKNINFSLFIPPKRSDYSTIYHKEYQIIHNQYMEKIEQYGVHSPIFSKNDIMDKYDDSIFFVDAYHLNAKGQAKFSEIFYELSQKENELYSKDYSWYEK